MSDLWFVLVVAAAYGGYVSGRKLTAARHQERREMAEARVRAWREGLDEALQEAGLRLQSGPLILVADASDSPPYSLAGFKYELAGWDVDQVSTSHHLSVHLEKRPTELDGLDADGARDVFASVLPYLDTPVTMMR